MKKITALAILPILALASCGTKNDGTSQSSTSTKDSSGATSAKSLEQKPEVKDLNPKVKDLNPKVGFSQESGAKPISFDYTLPNNQKVNVTGTILIQSGVVSGISLNGVDASKSTTPIQKFASSTFPKIVGKQIKGLKIDSVSGASLVSDAFNNYLNTINK